jgi:hypothetical protein
MLGRAGWEDDVVGWEVVAAGGAVDGFGLSGSWARARSANDMAKTAAIRMMRLATAAVDNGTIDTPMAGDCLAAGLERTIL